MKDQVSTSVTFELRPGGFLFHRLHDGRVMMVVSTVMESWAAHRMGRNLQLLGEAAEVRERWVAETAEDGEL